MRWTIAAAAMVLVMGTSPACAAGFELREFSPGAMGTAYAGAAASNSDASDLFYNPASLGFVQDWDGSVGATGLILNSHGRFSATTSLGTPTGGLTTPHAIIGDALIPALALRYRLADRWAVGVSLSTPFGELTRYAPTWTGRYYAVNTDLVEYQLTSIISYQPLKDLSVAAGAQIQYARAFLTEAIDFGTLGAVSGIPGSMPGQNDGRATLHGHGWGAGFVVGAQWQATPDLTLGVSYRSEIPQGLKGTERFTYDTAGIAATIHALTGAFADSTGQTDVSSPETIWGGARWTIQDRWTALAGFEYTNWSSFRQLLIRPSNPANPVDLTLTNWKSTWFGSLGAEYRADEQWTLRLGTAYDEAAAPQVTLGPRIPDATRIWLSAGVGYRWNSDMDVNFGVTRLFSPHARIDQSAAQPGNALRGNLAGVSSSAATLIGIETTLY